MKIDLIMVSFLTITNIFAYKYWYNDKGDSRDHHFGAMFELLWCDFNHLIEVDGEIKKEGKKYPTC